MIIGYNITESGIIDQIKNEDFILDKKMKHYIVSENLTKKH